jgi:serine/threonine protein kinase
MSLNPGDKLGPYEIVASIGQGGMGEVYRASDSRLRRDVAIKVCAEEFSERFEREARAVAALNHPNICTVHDLGPNYIVMEMVEGPTLAERIEEGPIPLYEALQIARQIADALEAAHEKGVVHRDLKPANIKLTPHGPVKVLDFGLAKVTAIGADSTDPSDSPTLTVGITQAGVVLGTAAYMAPEQARGRTVDKRADIWAFGAVLYEMLTGRRLFQGDTVSDILAAVIKEEPEWDSIPTRVQPLLRRCLTKDPKRRLRDIADAWALLEETKETPASRNVSPRFSVAVAAVLAVALGALAFVHFREEPPALQSLRYQVPLPGNVVSGMLALSPDGRQLAFADALSSGSLWIRALDSLEARELPGTEGATYPFWSPDGAQIGFFAQGKLKKIALSGGPPQEICAAADGRGGTWNRDGVVLFSPGPTSTLFRVSAAGGSPVEHAPGGAEGTGYRFPVFLPDGVHYLYHFISDKPDAAGLYAGSLEGGTPAHISGDNTNGLYAPPTAPGAPGQLLFVRGGTLMAQAFDPANMEATGEIVAVDQVAPGGNAGFGAFSVSSNGILVYQSAVTPLNRELVWVGRDGERLGPATRSYTLTDRMVRPLALSPDEQTAAIAISNGSRAEAPAGNPTDIWLQDLNRDVRARFTFLSGFNTSPVWSPDGRYVAFSTRPTGQNSVDLYRKVTTGGDAEELIHRGGFNAFVEDWSPDGKILVFRETGVRTSTDLWLLPLEGDRKPISYLQTPATEEDARFSPDGRWMAYMSNESGRSQVYVQSVPAGGATYQVSTDGGSRPAWRGDGQEVFYRSAEGVVMAVPVKLGASAELGTPQALFAASNASRYAPSLNGQRFLLSVPTGGDAAAASPVTLVTNWQAGLPK